MHGRGQDGNSGIASLKGCEQSESNILYLERQWPQISKIEGERHIVCLLQKIHFS
jgi:hypothetical protein